MAMKLNAGEGVRRGDLFFIDPNEIEVKEDLRGRVIPPTEADIIQRAESMLQFGQLQPVEARRIKENDNRLRLNMGFTRTAAARLIRKGFTGSDGTFKQDADFALQVKVVTCNDEAAFERNVVENAHCNQTSPIDDAHNQNKMRERYGKSDAEIATLYGYRTTQKVERLRQLLMLPNEIQLLVHNGQMSQSAAEEYLDLPIEKRDEYLQKATKSSGKIDTTALRQAARAENQGSQVTDDILSDDNRPAPTDPGSTDDNSKTKSRSMREVREFFDGLDGPGSDPAVQCFCKEVLSFIGGKFTEKQMENSLDRLLDAKRTKKTEYQRTGTTG